MMLGGPFLQAQQEFAGFVDGRLIDPINSETDQDKHAANIVVAADIYVNGQVYIAEGTRIHNRTEVQPRKGVGKPGRIRIDAISTYDTKGNTVPLTGTFLMEGKNNRAKALGIGIGVSVGTCFLPMLAYIAKKGGPADTAPNTIIHDFHVAR